MKSKDPAHTIPTQICRVIDIANGSFGELRLSLKEHEFASKLEELIENRKFNFKEEVEQAKNICKKYKDEIEKYEQIKDLEQCIYNLAQGRSYKYIVNKPSREKDRGFLSTVISRYRKGNLDTLTYGQVKYATNIVYLIHKDENEH